MDIKTFLENGDRFASDAGCVIESVARGRACVRMDVDQRHLNAGGVCQGGALFTLADLAMAAVMNYSGRLTFSIQSSVMFLKSAVPGDRLTAVATEIVDHRRVPSLQVEVRNQHGDLVCHVTGLAYRKDMPLP